MHLPHNTPPNGLSGLFFVFARFLILCGRSLGTPFRAVLQFEHFAILCFFRLYCRLVLPPGTFLKILLRLLDLNLGAGMLFWKEYLFINVGVNFELCLVEFPHLAVQIIKQSAEGNQHSYQRNSAANIDAGKIYIDVFQPEGVKQKEQ